MSKRIFAGVVFCLLSGMVAAQTGSANLFGEAPQYSTGTNPQAAVAQDLNGDGKLDVVVANSTANTVSVLLGKGDGTFGAKTDYATGNVPEGIAFGDFNGDGHLDLAVTNSASNTVSILLGNGDGTFQPKVDYSTGRGPRGIAVSDFNGDGHYDLVVTNATDGTVGVLLGKGDGTFGPQATYNTGLNPYSVAVADFNNDGIPDLAVANNNNNNVISVLLGKGDGTFNNQFQYGTGSTPVWVAVADLNADGKVDIVVVDQAGNSVSILLGNGNGSFQNHVDYPTANFPTSVTIGDFNGDGVLDLAVSGGNGNTITVLWGEGEGIFQGQENVGTGDIPYSVVSGDFNNDGKLDLVAANSGSNSISVILNNGNETFQARTDYPAGPGPYSVATADFNGDGFLDLAVANSDCPVFPNCGPSTISIILGNGDGTFQAPSHYSTGTDTDPYSIAVGDFNGDKIPDLAVANYATNTVSIMLGKGDGSFQGNTTFPVESEPASVATGDFNGDGKLDLVVANFHSNTLSVLLGNGDGTFKSAVTYSVGHGPVSVAVKDFNGDGKLDLVVVNETDNNASILLGNGDGTFKPGVAYPTGVGGNPLSVVVGDFNGDKIPDLAIGDYQTQEVSILLGNGDGSFQAVKQYPTGANPSSIVAADFNGDGKLDLALTSTPLGSSQGNLVSVLPGNGDGTFGAFSLFGAGYLSYSAAVGDFNGDGTPDLATANGGSNTVSVLLNTRGTAITVSSSGNPAVYGQSVTVTATVAASVANGNSPTGTVTLKNGSTVIGTGHLASGMASVGPVTLPVGTNSLSAVYSGDSNYQSHAIAYSQMVQAANSTTALSLSSSAVNVGQSVTLTATVAPAVSGTPTGTVVFLDGTVQIGSAALNGSGVATITISTLAAGTHSISASYGGDSNFNLSASSPANVVVTGPGFSLTASSLNPSSVAPGQSAQSTITVQALGGLDPSTVKLTCSVSGGGSPAPTCSLGQISVANTNGTSTLTVATTGPQAALGPSPEMPGTGIRLLVGMMIPAMLLGGAGLSKTQRRKFLNVSFLVLLISGCLLQAACGGSGNTPASNTTVSSNSTAAGTYKVTVTGNAAGMTAQTAVVSLTVQ